MLKKYIQILLSVRLTVKPRVEKIQYKEPGSSVFSDIGGTLFILKGSVVSFKAIPSPSSSTFPSGLPTWGGTSGASGTGETISITFSTSSVNATDFKTVTAAVVSPVVVNVIVYDLKGILNPRDMFDPYRNNIKFGLEELVDLNFESKPTLTLAEIGDLRWTISTGTGTLPPQDDGKGVFTAPEAPESAILKLEILNGPSKGQFVVVNISIIAPSNARLVKTSNIRHNYGSFGGAFKGDIYFDPKDVSFSRLRFGEGSAIAVATGYLSGRNGLVHSPTGIPVSISNCSLAMGCKILGEDTITLETTPARMPFSNGTFLWAIPWKYFTTNSNVVFTTADHTCNADIMGNAYLGKKNAGPFTIGVYDPTTSF